MAVAEGRSVPTLKGGEDVRPLNMDDFKQAHERVTSSILVCMLYTHLYSLTYALQLNSCHVFLGMRECFISVS